MRNRTTTNHIREGPTDAQAEQMLQAGWRAATSIGAKPMEADDASQVAMEHILLGWRTDRIQRVLARNGDTGLVAYTAASAKNAHRSFVRSRSRSVAREQRWTVGEPGFLERRPRDTSGIEDMLARQVLQAEIRRLPQRQRECAELIWIEGFKIAEVAEILGIEAQTVRKHMRSANQRLKRRLQDND